MKKFKLIPAFYILILFLCPPANAYFYIDPVIYIANLKPSPLNIPQNGYGQFTSPVNFQLDFAIVNPNLFPVTFSGFHFDVFDEDAIFMADDNLGQYNGNVSISINAGMSIYEVGKTAFRFQVEKDRLNKAIGLFEGNNLEPYAKGYLTFNLPENKLIKVNFISSVIEPASYLLFLVGIFMVCFCRFSKKLMTTKPYAINPLTEGVS